MHLSLKLDRATILLTSSCRGCLTICNSRDPDQLTNSAWSHPIAPSWLKMSTTAVGQWIWQAISATRDGVSCRIKCRPVRYYNAVRRTMMRTASSTLFHRDQPFTDRHSSRLSRRHEKLADEPGTRTSFSRCVPTRGPLSLGKTPARANASLQLSCLLRYKHTGCVGCLPHHWTGPPRRRSPHRFTFAAKNSRRLGLRVDDAGGLCLCACVVSSIVPVS